MSKLVPTLPLLLGWMFTCVPPHAHAMDPPARATGARVQAAISSKASCRIDDLDGVRWCRVGCGTVVIPPKLIRRVEPDLAQVPTPHPAGVVVLEVGVDETGTVRAACVRRGLGDEVDTAVMRAVLAWRYAPAIVKKAGLPGKNIGDPVRVVITTTTEVR